MVDSNSKNSKKGVLDNWDDYDQNHPENAQLRGDAEFDGPVKDRKCTDIFYLIFFILTNFGLVFVCYFIIPEGDLHRLTHGFDFRAEICGYGGLSDRPYMYWPDPYNLDFSLCVQRCPEYFITDYICLYDTDHKTLLLDWGCWDTVVTTYYGYYCVPVTDQARKKVLDYLYQPMILVKRSVGDLALAWDTVVMGLVLSIGIGLVYLVCFRIPYVMHALMIVSIFTPELLFLYFIYLFREAQTTTHQQLCGESDAGAEPEYCYQAPSDGFYYLMFVALGFAVAYAIWIIMKWRLLKLGVSIIMLSCRPLHTLKQFFLYPFMLMLSGISIIGLLTLLVLYTMSTGTQTTVSASEIPGGYSKKIEDYETEKYMMIYNVFITLWWLVYLIAFGEFVLSSSVSVWYFTRERSSLYYPLWKGFKSIIRYHLGSTVRGSLFNSILAIPNAIMTSYTNMLYKLKKNHHSTANCLGKCCACLSCYQKYLRFFTDYAFIFLALFGHPFFECAKKSYYLLKRNKDRVNLPSQAGQFVIFIIKATICLSGTALTYSLLLLQPYTPRGQDTDLLVAPSWLAFYSLIVGWFTAQVFGGSMAACMNTVVLCGACDEEMFTREQRFMDHQLQAFLDSVYEEQTEQQRESKERAVMQNPKKVYQKASLLDNMDEEGAIMLKPIKNNYTGTQNASETLMGEDTVINAQRPNLAYNNNDQSNFHWMEEDTAEDRRPQFSR